MSHTRLFPPHWRASPATASAPELLAARRSPVVVHTSGVGTARGVAWLGVFCALWLATFVWLIPAASTLLARQTYTLTTETISAFVRSTARSHALWQVGLQASEADADATAMRATIDTRLPQRVDAGTTSYFWVGSYLADGSFIQVGYYVPDYAPASAGWFYCAFSRARVKGPCVYGALGSVSGGAHTYALSATRGPGGEPLWSAAIDSRPVGSFAWSAGDTGSASPSIYVESSAMRPHAADSILGPVTFSGFAIRPRGASAYRLVSTVNPTYSTIDVCPPYGIRALGRGQFMVGSGLDCPSPLATLW